MNAKRIIKKQISKLKTEIKNTCYYKDILTAIYLPPVRSLKNFNETEVKIFNLRKLQVNLLKM